MLSVLVLNVSKVDLFVQRDQNFSWELCQGLIGSDGKQWHIVLVFNGLMVEGMVFHYCAAFTENANWTDTFFLYRITQSPALLLDYDQGGHYWDHRSLRVAVTLSVKRYAKDVKSSADSKWRRLVEKLGGGWVEAILKWLIIYKCQQ